MIRILTLFMVVSFVFTLPISAKNSNFCVSCFGPQKTYKCNVDNLTGGHDSALGLHCVINIAKDHNHASCSVNKRQSEACDGKPIQYVYNKATPSSVAGNNRILPGADDTTSGSLQKPSQKPQSERTGSLTKPKASQKKKEPDTLIELTDQAIEGSKKSIKKAGEKISNTADKIGNATKKTTQVVSNTAKKVGNEVGNAAKSTFTCITSLFANC